MNKEELEIKIDMLLDYKKFIVACVENKEFNGGASKQDMLDEIEIEIEFYLEQFVHTMNGIVPVYS